MLCKNVRIVGDVSSVEVLVNDGALVFSTRIYPEDYGVTVDAPGANVTYHALNIQATRRISALYFSRCPRCGKHPHRGLLF